MGNAPFTISLDSSQPIAAGQRVKGCDYATVKSRISGKSMQVSFLGDERTCVEYHTGSGKDRQTRHAYGARSIVHADIPFLSQCAMFIQNGHVEPGNYTLPFEIELPGFLPASMQLGNPSNSYAKIEYKIKAELLGSGMFSNYQCERAILVLACPLRQETSIVPFEGPPTTVPITSCCCWQQGSFTFGAMADNTLLNRGTGTSNVSMACRNDSREDVGQVNLELRQTCKWFAGSHTKTLTSALQSRQFSNSRFDASVTKGQDLPSLTRSASERATLLGDMRSGKYSTSITMPQSALLSYSSGLITVEHHIILTAQTQGTCTTQPTIVIPVKCLGSASETAPQGNFTESLPQGSNGIPEGFSTIGAMQATATVVTAGQMIPGGDISVGNEPDIVVSPNTLYNTDTSTLPSMENLLLAMKLTVADQELIRQKCNDPDWQPILAAVTPAQLGQILEQVDMDFDQAAVAVLVAEQVGASFSCAHVVAAMQRGANWNRSALVEQLLPHCRDLRAHHDVIRQELTSWEQTVTAHAFQVALEDA